MPEVSSTSGKSMNERIKELFKRAGGKSSKRNLMSNPVQVVETHELWDERIEKFAELIVKECVEHCNEIGYAWSVVDDGVRASGASAGAFECARELKYHFGVE